MDQGKPLDLLEIAECLRGLERVVCEENLPVLDRAHEALCYMAQRGPHEPKFTIGQEVWTKLDRIRAYLPVQAITIENSVIAYGFGHGYWRDERCVFATREEAEEAWSNAETGHR